MAKQFTMPFETTGGTIRGYYEEDGIMAFKGVPYAEPPVGDLRWKPAVKYAARPGVRDCVEYSASAWQNQLDSFSQRIWTPEFIITNKNFSEDCLTLNFWAPVGKTGMPVLLYFYGGGFVSGGSSCEIYDGKTFAKNGVIFMTFNHREGVLAWLGTDDLKKESDKGVAGNYMLSDAVAALEWIRDNIEAFGGDPNNITICGQSSGASEVNLLAVSPVAKDLFARTISMGYNTLQHNEWKTLDQAVKEGNEVESKFGGSLEAMRAVPPQDFLPYVKISAPAIDGYYVEDSFGACLERGAGAEKPFMMGCVYEDGKVTKWNRALHMCRDLDEYRKLLEADFPETAGEIEKKYAKDGNYMATLKEFCRDMLIKGMLEFSLLRAASGSQTYLYLFKHVMPGPESDLFGAYHSFEVPYVTNVFSDLRKDYWTDADRHLGLYMNELFSNFAKYGDPRCEGFEPARGNNLFIIDTNEQYDMVMPDGRFEELQYLFGKD